jgi:FKBP-type peptidyl-prolyl cis-trans isomerase SlyD
MTMSDQIAMNKVVEVRYSMKDDRGEVLDQTGETPETYVHGRGTLVPGLRRALEGRKVGDRFEVTLEPRQAFGSKRKGSGAQPVPRATFPPDTELQRGMSFEAETPNREPVRLYIVRIVDDVVYVDTNHPFAGRTIIYNVEVVSIRDATPDEQKTGKPA